MSVIISGGGMTGVVLALAISHLTKGKLPVTIVEAIAPENLSRSYYEKRAIALSEGTCQKLAWINLWPILADCATPITRIQVSDRGHSGFVTIDAADYGISALGNVIQIYEIRNRLYQLLYEARGITLRCPETVSQIERIQDRVSVIIKNGEKLNGQLLITADGSYPNIASACGIQFCKEDYQQIAIIANVKTQIPHHGCAYERFTKNGPLALLPMLNGQSSLVWCHSLQEKACIKSWSDAIFLKELQQTFGWRLGRFTHVEYRNYYPIALKIACRITSHRLVLVGNAAQTLHPITGQGFNLGIRDVMSLAETLAAAYHEKRDVGSFSILQHYEKQRITDRNNMISITDGLVRLFTSCYLPLVIGRNIGLIIMNNLPQFRNHLVKWMLG